MPNKPISMAQIRQALRCYAVGKGSKTIGKMLGMHRTTVKKIELKGESLRSNFRE